MNGFDVTMPYETHNTVTLGERNWLEWLVKARIIIITFLLGIELTITSLMQTNVPKGLFVSVIVLWYTVAVFFLVLRHAWNDSYLQARLQILTDIVFSAAVIYVTGGIDTFFNFLFPLVIIVAAILLPRYWAYMTAAISFICFGAVLELSYFEVVRSFSATKPDLKSLQAALLINLCAYLAIAYLASTLSLKLRQVRVQLEAQSGALENLQALHADVVNSVSGGLITTDLEGRVSFVNPAAERLMERSSSELFGHRIEDLLPERVPEIGPAGIRFEAHTTTDSGTRKTIGMSISPLRVPSGGVVGYVYSFNDLTEIRRLEREVRVRDRMAAVGRLAAGIAHEIRNPLSSIAGSAKLLRDSAALDDDERSLMDIVKRESERLNAIVTDFLSYSREKEYRFADVDLVALLTETLTLLRNRFEPPTLDAGIEIVTNFAVPKAVASVDADRLKQVFWNICDNAIRAMGEKGKLTVSLRGGAAFWVIEFADTGVGIAPQQLEKIFEPFQSGFKGGTGLGLALVYEIVQAHAGKISVQSKPGEGSTFKLQLKQAGSAEGAQPLAQRVAAGGVED